MSGVALGGDAGAAASAAPRVVIDTNAWLDLFVFEDVCARGLARVLSLRALQPVRNAACDDELIAVLARPAIAARRDAAEVQSALTRWKAAALEFDAPAPAPWRCRDPDDQKFLDLASACSAAYLVTKDRALLDLARKTRSRGLQIVPPSAIFPLSPAERGTG